MIERCAAEGVNPGYPLGADYDEFEDGLLVAITEQRSQGRHRPAGRGAGRRGRGRARGGDGVTVDDLREVGRGPARVRGARARRAARRRRAARERFRRAEPPKLPEISEPEIVRHYTTLSTRNFHVDKGFYPLGSCTMKHNPKLHERVAALPGPRAPAPAAGAEARPGRAAADVGAPGARWPRSPGCRTCRCSRRPGRRASWRACCSRAPTTSRAASTGTRSSRPTPRTAPTRRP